ncbi:RsbRD N-terminal domain-containing protein [Thermosulfurimonas sp. F29]|uniref:RsbRD N-terminal domain-containing protein n=1 Tax=Thermosulfurimonas sp. F29 TaxID=2867247 RepID=UPI001C8283F9|nr:RsbRD N-terminal domain-containing protein [Thermosulfurimonas sp. F29]MBX6423621.1 RsbRD N-terminal domain-containing protein [Thermosulfurimonas sp. F29]
MTLKAARILKAHESSLFKVLREKVYETFPRETVRFLKRETDRFENPLGYRLEEGLKGLVNQLAGDLSWERVDYYLDRIIKIEAVQSRRPSEALAFLFFLKSAVREVVGEEILRQYGPEALLEVEDRIDAFMLRAFNQYMEARERLNEIKFQEWKSRLYLLLKRAGYLYDEREGSLPPEASYNEKTH